MRTFSLFLASALALCAQANQPSPFNFNLSATYPSSADTPQPATLTYNGTSTWGACAYTETARSGPPPNSISLTVDFGQGTLTITTTSSLQNPFSPVNFIVSGGTGMFTAATGMGSFQDIYSNPTSTTGETTLTATGTITLADGAGVTVLPGSLQVQTPAGTPATGQIALSNQGSTSVNYTVAVDSPAGTPWLSVNPPSGTVQAGAAASLQITVNPGGLALGVYQGQIDVDVSGGLVQFPVTMVVGTQGADLQLSQTGLQFLASAGGPSPAAQTITVANTEIGNLSGLTAATSVTGTGANWLQATIASGFASQTTTPVSITTTPGKLPPGVYSGQVTFTLPNAFDSPQTLTVQMVISTAVPTFQPPAIVAKVPFDSGAGALTGALPGPFNIVITNPSLQALNFTIGPVTLSSGVYVNPPFFNLTAQSGTVPAGGSSSIPVSVNAACFTDPTCSYNVQGLETFDGWLISFPAINFSYIYWANIVLIGPSSAPVIPSWGSPPSGLNFPTGSAVPANHTFERPQATVSHAGAACTPSVLDGALTSFPASGFQASVGAPLPIAVTIFDNCGSNLNSGSVSVTFSDGDGSVPLTAFGGGQWAATWVPSKPSSGVVMSIQAVASSGISGTGFIPGTVAADTSTPLVNPGGVVNAASGTPVIAPGAFISIYGQNMAAGTTIESTPVYPTALDGTQVLLDGEPLPLYFTANNQIDAVVPFDIAAGSSGQLVVQNGTVLSIPVNVPVGAASPGVFTQDQSGKGPGAILGVHGAGATPILNTPANPSQAGDALEIFCTGLGLVSPAVTAGTPASSTDLSWTVNTVTATVGGVDAQVFFAGLAPGYVGLYQVNLFVPVGVTPSNSVPIVLHVAGVSSAPVTVALQ